MNLETQIMNDLKEAMKAKDQAAIRSIRSIKSALLLQKTDGSGEEITPEKEIKILQKLVKQRQDSLDIFVQQGRDDLAKTEKEEIEVISKYLPKQLSSDELREAIRAIILELDTKEMGKIIGAANQKLAGRSEGKLIASMVKELIQN
jgi:hypothetical protein